MKKWSLPSEWKWQALAGVADDTDRRNPSAQPDLEFSYVDIGSVDPDKGAIKLDEVRVLLGEQAPSRARKVIRQNDIIFATTRPYLKNIAEVPSELDNQICSTGFCVIHAKEGIAHPSYLYHACRSGFFIEQLLPKQRGANYPAVVDGNVFATEIPIPYPDDPTRSLAEQRRIVARIEALFAELRGCQQTLDHLQTQTGRLMNSFVVETFMGPATKGWKQTVLEDLMVGTPQYGTSQKAEADEQTGVPVLRMGNIQDGKLDVRDLKYVELSERDQAKYKLQYGDIIFNRTNSAELVGKSAVFDSSQLMVFASYLIRFKVDADQTNPWFIKYYINSSLGRKYIQSQLVRAIGQVNVNAQKLKAMPIPLPSTKQEQDSIVGYLMTAEGEISDMQETQAADARNFAEMEQAILNQAFRGEL